MAVKKERKFPGLVIYSDLKDDAFYSSLKGCSVVN